MNLTRWTGIAACLLLSTVGGPASASAQTILRSGDGKASIIGQGGLLTVSFADKSIDLGYAYVPSANPTGGPSVRFGGGAKMKATDGFAAIFEEQNGLRLPEAALAAHVGLYWLPNVPWLIDLSVVGEIEYTRGTFNLTGLDPMGTPFLRDTVFNGVVPRLRVNSLTGALGPFDFGWGVSIGYGRQNTYEQATKFEYCAESGTGVVDGETVRLQACTPARELSEYEARDAFEASLDVVIWQTWFEPLVAPLFSLGAGVDLFLRYDEIRPDDELLLGFQVFFTRGGSPLVPLGGIVLQWRDSDFEFGVQASIPLTP